MSELYIPKGCTTLDKSTFSFQIRLGIQGYPNTSKTWAALTFPNPIVLNMDRKLGAHVGRTDVIETPMWYPPFVDSIVMRDGALAPPNRKDAVLKWIGTEGMKLSENQTLIVDGSTQLQNAFKAQYDLNPEIEAKSGKINKYGQFTQKITYFTDIFETLKSLKCHVVYICHETGARDDDGEMTTGVRPLLSGQMGDQMAGHFSDWFRALAIAKPLTDDRKAKMKAAFNLTDERVKEWCASTDNETIYLWQTQSDEVAKCGTSLLNAPKLILANYKEYAKYQRKVN